MTSGNLIVVVEGIARLSCGGYAERASWLRGKKATLERSSSDDEMMATKAELHRVVHRMNGLLDIWSTPAERCKMSAPEATRELHRLAEQLYELTR
jgi:hypothetical protein